MKPSRFRRTPGASPEQTDSRVGSPAHNAVEDRDESLYAARLREIHREETRRRHTLAVVIALLVIALTIGVILLIVASPISFESSSQPR